MAEFGFVRRPDTDAPGACREMEPLTIVHVVMERSGEHPLDANGVYRVAHQIAVEQAKAGHSVRLVIFREPPVSSDLPVVDDVELLVQPLAGMRTGAKLIEALALGRPSRTVVHIHSGREPLLVSLCLRLKWRAISYVMTVHGRYSHLFGADERRRAYLSEFYLRTIERPVLNAALFVHAVSRHERDVIRRVAPHARIGVVPNAAGSSVGSGACPQRQWQGPPQIPHFGYLGRYAIHHKGLDLLIRGFSIYRARGGRGRLDLHGTGTSCDELAALVRALGVSSSISVGGARFGEDKEKAFGDWHYFVQPSRFEGSPIGALEAALTGLPLIVTPGTGLDDDVRRRGAGIPIDEPNAEAVARALLRADAVSAATWERMSRQATLLAQSIGSWADVAARVTSLYRGRTDGLSTVLPGHAPRTDP